MRTCKRKLGDVPKQRIISFCPLYGVKGWGGSRCVACARQVYVMPDPGLKGAAIGAQHPQWDVAYCAFIISISTPAQP
jgi:hypothetical protein